MLQQDGRDSGQYGGILDLSREALRDAGGQEPADSFIKKAPLVFRSGFCPPHWRQLLSGW